MNLVIVTGLLNYPLETGGDVVTYHLIKELSLRHNLTVMYPAYKDVEKNRAELQQLLPGVELIVFNHDKKHYSFSEKLGNRVRGFLAPIKKGIQKLVNAEELAKQEVQHELFYNTDFTYIVEVINRKANEGKVDLVQVEYPWMMGLVEQIPSSVPSVFVAIELTFSMVAEKAETFTGEEREWWLKKQQYAKEKEMELGSKYDAIFTISTHDKQVWDKALPNHNIEYTPSGIDTEFYKSRGKHGVFNRVVFIGHGKHHANLDAVEEFFDKIYPVLKHKVPDFKMVFTGEYKQQFRDKFPKDPNITWTGFLDDLRDALDGSISIAPMRIGSGLRIKILESMSYGCPVVTSEIGREGIPVTDGYDVLIRNEPEDFANAVANLLLNPSMALQLSENARATIVKNFELKNVATLRDNAFRKVIEQHQHHSK